MNELLLNKEFVLSQLKAKSVASLDYGSLLYRPVDEQIGI